MKATNLFWTMKLETNAMASAWNRLMLIVTLAWPLYLQGSMVDNGDGTVTDADLGIMWLKAPGPDANWSNAVAWAEALVYAGHSDWRLPSALHFTTGLPDTGWNSINNEFGHLYGAELGNPAGSGDIAPLVGYGCCWFWTGTPSATNAYAFFWSFDGVWLNNATQPGIARSTVLHVTAVRKVQPSALAVSPTTLTPGCTQGTDAASQSFEVWNSGEGTLNYTITVTNNWLSCTPTSGTSTGEHDAITVHYSTTGLAPGTYNGTITVTAAGASGSPQTVAVALTVVPLTAQLAVSPTVLSPRCSQGENAPSETFDVWNSGGGTLSYTVSEGIDWLSCTPTNGTSNGEHDPIAVNYTTVGLASGTYNGTIAVTAAGVGGPPQTVAVTLRVAATMMISANITPSNTLSVTWPGGSGAWLERATRLDSAGWLAVPGTEGASRLELPLTNASAFYRVAISPQALLILEQPVSVAVTQGDPALLSVAAVSADSLSYKWRFQGTNLPGANGSTLSLPSVQPANVGEYVAVVSNSSGSITSSPAAVVITAPLGHLVWIPSNTFIMGSPDSEVGRDADESPQATVTLSHGFWMGTHEVTQEQYVDVMGNNPSYFTGGVNQPVEFLSWGNATSYCGTLTQRERSAGRIPANHEYRLPTEAEWECAGRAGTITRFSYGDDPGYGSLGDYAWYSDNSSDMTHPVGQKLTNPWGLHDMHGNVWEWCRDWYGPYPGGSITDPKGPTTGSMRILRGGSYYYDGLSLRSANRGAMDSTGSRYDVGLRVVLAPTTP